MAAKKGSDTSYADGDNRNLVTPPGVDHGLPWMDAPSSQTTVTGPTPEASYPWGSQSNARGAGGKRTWDESATKTCDDIEMQATNRAAGGGINVKNDFDIQWTSTGEPRH